MSTSAEGVGSRFINPAETQLSRRAGSKDAHSVDAAFQPTCFLEDTRSAMESWAEVNTPSPALSNLLPFWVVGRHPQVLVDPDTDEFADEMDKSRA